MARLPYQVLVIPYMRKESGISYCIFQRKSPKGQVQFVAGGGEGDETPLQAANREIFEETGISNVDCRRLTSVCHIPTNIFSEEQRQAWGIDLYVVPEYSFGVEVESDNIKLSHEHTGFKWVTYNEAMSKLEWDSNKTALYELNCRLFRTENSHK